jgi:DNA-binding NarL/FixJ family response regulator
MTVNTFGPEGRERPSEIHVLLADARIVMREALAALIDREPDIAVVGQTETAADGREFGADPHVVITEIDLPDVRGTDAITAFRGRFSRSAILVLTTSDYPARVEEALAAGAQGYVLKTATAAEFLQGIRAVASGGAYLQPKLGVALARWHDPRPNGDVVGGWARLSPRETEVLRHIAGGHTNVEIAQLVAMSLRTVEAHRSAIQQKLRVRTRAELVRYAQRAGLATLHD